MNEKKRFRVQAYEMRFLRTINGLTLLDKVNSEDVCESPNIESLLLRLERSQLHGCGHVTRMSQKKITKKQWCKITKYFYLSSFFR